MWNKKNCEKCGIKKWEGKNVPLELHHINGNSNDHRIENLKILCPNCYALTDNYRGKNLSLKGKKKVSDEKLITALENNKNIRQALLSVDLKGKGGNYKRCRRLINEQNIKFKKKISKGTKKCENETRSKIKGECKDCGKEILPESKRCKSCEMKHRSETKIDWPKTEWIEEMVEKYSYLALSRRLGVSDNGIRKRIKNH